MLTRLRVKGFKNLLDVDVRFGPFTCIAGANGVGKSNLLDAILFLSALADRTLMDAALSIRDQGARTGDIRALFHHSGDRYGEEMELEAEMLIPAAGVDELGQDAKASSTFVRYALTLRFKQGEGAAGLGGLEILKEELSHITRRGAAEALPFSKSRAWRDNAVQNNRRISHYISTAGQGSERVIKVHQDGGSSGKPQTLKAASLPRTVLSAANAAESPTATLVKREMQSWRLLQLEPSALREPDSFTAPTELASDGAHLPAMLFHLNAAATNANGHGSGPDPYAAVANRMAELLDDVRAVHVDRDESRRLLTLYVTGRDGTGHPARSLSDGTLRFLALAALAEGPDSGGLLCLEEPENGIHPERIPAMIRLLRDLTTDVCAPAHDDPVPLPTRQVIVNTHSPAVVLQVPPDALIFADAVEVSREGRPCRALELRCLPGTWRTLRPIALGNMLAYLNPVPRHAPSNRVIDGSDFRQLLLPLTSLDE